MTRLVVSSTATSDFSDFLDRLLALAGYAIAERYARDLRMIYQRLGRFPEIGSPRPKLGTSARIVVLEPYLIVYDYFSRDDVINIIRIVDGRRNITRRLMRG